MDKVYIIGSSSTAFGRRPQDTIKELAAEAYEDVLKDAGFDNGDLLESAWFGNCGMWADDQACIRGQVSLTPQVRSGLFPERVPITNVEGGCATASLALNGAWKDVLSGQSEFSLAIGVEKTFFPEDPEKMSARFYSAIDQYDPHEWQDYYRAAGKVAGKEFEPGPDRTIFMDTYAMQACFHMKHHGTTQRQIAAGAAKNHTHAAANPKAQYRFEMSVDDVLADRAITYPLTRSMCAPIGDGAAAAIVCSESALKTLPGEVRERAILIRGQGLSGGKYRGLEEDGLSRFAAERAYKMAGLTPNDVDVAEVHDATSFCEIYQVEMMGFCEKGQGGAFVESGATTLGGELPVNTSGGLVSKGHPVGATGLSMTNELVQQLRGEAGERQVEGAHVALAENGGGVVGFDEAACSVLLMSRP